MRGYSLYRFIALPMLGAAISTSMVANAQTWEAMPKKNGNSCTLTVVDVGYLLIFSFSPDGDVTIVYNDDKLRMAPSGPSVVTMTLERKADGSTVGFPIEGNLSKTDRGPLFGAIIGGHGKSDPFANALITVLGQSTTMALEIKSSKISRTISMATASESLAAAKKCVAP